MKGFPKDIISKFDSYKYTDERGFNAINFEDFKNNISYKESFSKKNVFRGMHVQLPPFAQSKYIQVSNGSIIDFIIPLDSSRNDFGNLYHQLKVFTIFRLIALTDSMQSRIQLLNISV